MKKIAWNILQRGKCIKNGAPRNCSFYRGSRVKRSSFEGHNVVGRNAFIADSQIGYGTFVGHNSNVISCRIGRYCAVGFTTSIGAHPLHGVASIHPALYSAKGQYGFTYVDKNYFEEYSYADEANKKAIVIGNDVWITPGATKIVQNITIGDGAVVMLDAVVTKNVPPYAIVGGIPAKIIGYRFTEGQIAFLLKLKWWDRGEDWIKSHAAHFRDIARLQEIVLKEEPDLFQD